MSIIHEYENEKIFEKFFKRDNVDKLEEIIYKKDNPFFQSSIEDERNLFILNDFEINDISQNIFNFVDNNLNLKNQNHPFVLINERRKYYPWALFPAGLIFSGAFLSGNVPLAISSLGAYTLSAIGLETEKGGYSRLRNKIFVKSRYEIITSLQATDYYLRKINEDNFSSSNSILTNGVISSMQEKVFKNGKNYHYIGHGYTNRMNNQLKSIYSFLGKKFGVKLNSDLFDEDKIYPSIIDNSLIGYTMVSILEHDNPDVLKEIYSDIK